MPRREQGFSIVEVLLAATIFGFLVLALIGALVYGRQSTANAGDRNRANYIAEEGLEATRNIGYASFANLVDTATAAGNTAIESGNDANANSTSAMKISSGTASGNLNYLAAYIKSVDNANPNVQMAIYSDVSNAPGTRLGVSAIQTGVANTWNIFPITGVTISASTNYWIGLSENGITTFASLIGSGNTTAYDLSGGYPAPATFSVDGGTAIDRMSFFMSVGNNSYGLAKTGNQWTFSGTSDVTDIYTRQVSVLSTGTNRKLVTSTVSWPRQNGTAQTSVATLLSNWRATLIPPIIPGPIMMAYSKTTAIPYYRIWDGSSWGAEGAASTVAGNINYVVLKSARTRNEAILGVQTTSGAIYTQIWNGSSWSAATQVGTATSAATRAFDIAYEKNTDEAVITYSPSFLSADFAYRVWNGSTLSAATTITTPPTTGTLNWIEMKQNPLSSSSEISLIMLDNNSDVYGMRWTGSAWDTMGTAAVWDASAASPTKKAIDVDYEQTSGEALFMWGDSVSTDQYYRTWNGTTLSAATLLDIAGTGGVSEWVQLAARPNSNEIMLGVQDAGADLNTRKWSGSAWDAAAQHVEHSAATENISSRNFDIVWETHASNPGVAWLMWGNGTAVSAKRWSGTAWGTASVLAGSDDTSFVRLRADPTSGTVFSGIYQNATSATTARDISARQLTGGGSTWSAKNVIWGGPTSTDPVYFRIDISTP